MEPERSRLYPSIARPGANPMAIERAEGAYLIAQGGRRILDAAGCKYSALVQELDMKFKRPGEMSIHRHVKPDVAQ